MGSRGQFRMSGYSDANFRPPTSSPSVMAIELLCKNGHLWDISMDGMTPTELASSVCPVCGAPCSPAIDRTERFIDETWQSEPADENAPHQPLPELPIVPGYDVIGVLGEGGMGKVFKARHLRLDRIVALKMISPMHRKRFQTEGRALAKLDDPHIVQIFEVNECRGIPYFSLEYLEGGSLDRKLAGMPQPPWATARLIEILARAIHTAHLQGFVHRDLKPANILLNREGVPKISDFGLAKRFMDDSSQTRTGDLLGTPAYMSPEQTVGDNDTIGPATDVYALGVIMYEMLTGRPPFRGINSLETLQLIRKVEPVSPRRLQPGVPRDLETICLKCMEKAPAKRYATAMELADDLARFQSHQPIRARRSGAAERIGKWTRRNPIAAALIGVIVLAIVSLGLLGAWSNTQLRFLAKRADNRSRVARSVVDDLYTQFAEEWLSEEPYKDPIRQQFLEKALRLYQEFAAEETNDVGLRREIGMSLFRLGQIHRILNEHVDAESSYKRAIVSQKALATEFPGVADYREDLANSHNWLGELYRQRDAMAEAERHYLVALGLQNELLNESPAHPTFREELARTHYNLAIVLMDTSRLDLAATHLASADKLLERLHHEYPEVHAYRHEWSRCFINRGVLHHAQNEVTAAERDYRRAIELLQPLVPTSDRPSLSQENPGPARAVYRSDLSAAHRNLGNLLWASGSNDDALSETNRALEILRQLVADFPARPAYQRTLAETHNSLASVLASKGRWNEAEQNYEIARSLLQRLVDDHADVLQYQQLLGMTLGNLGWVDSERGEWQQAFPLIQAAIGYLETALQANPKNAMIIRALGGQYQSMAEVAIRLGNHRVAAEAATKLASIKRTEDQDSYYAACFLARCLPLVAEDSSFSDAPSRATCQRDYAQRANDFLQRAAASQSVQRLANEQEILRTLFDFDPSLQESLQQWQSPVEAR